MMHCTLKKYLTQLMRPYRALPGKYQKNTAVIISIHRTLCIDIRQLNVRNILETLEWKKYLISFFNPIINILVFSPPLLVIFKKGILI